MKQGAILLSSLRGGGAERELLLLARELSRRGWQIDLVLVNAVNSAYVPDPQIRIVDLCTRRIRYAIVPLVRYLRSVRPGFMLSAETPVNVLAILARWIAGFPRRLVVSERNHLSMVARHASRPADRLRPALVRWLYPRADLVIAVSSGVANDLVRLSRLEKTKVRAIYNMFDIDEIVGKSRSEPGGLPFQSRQQPILISVGRLTAQKDQATLLHAFSSLRSKRDCRLVILGEGPERKRLLDLTRSLALTDDVWMPGFVPNPYAYIAAAAAFVLSSAWEGLPGVLIEALACGTPVISTDCPSGPAEILENGRYGMLTPVGDPNALANAIQKTLDGPRPGAELLQRALDFSIERLLPDFMAALDPDTSSPPRAP